MRYAWANSFIKNPVLIFPVTVLVDKIEQAASHTALSTRLQRIPYQLKGHVFIRYQGPSDFSKTSVTLQKHLTGISKAEVAHGLK